MRLPFKYPSLYWHVEFTALNFGHLDEAVKFPKWVQLPFCLLPGIQRWRGAIAAMVGEVSRHARFVFLTTKFDHMCVSNQQISWKFNLQQGIQQCNWCVSFGHVGSFGVTVFWWPGPDNVYWPTYQHVGQRHMPNWPCNQSKVGHCPATGQVPWLYCMCVCCGSFRFLKSIGRM